MEKYIEQNGKISKWINNENISKQKGGLTKKAKVEFNFTQQVEYMNNLSTRSILLS